MKEFNFQAPNYSQIGQRIDRDYERIGNNFNQFATSIGRGIDAWRDEEEQKKKWDEMLADKQYQRDYQQHRDQLADERYNAEFAMRKAEADRQEELRRQRYETMRRNQEILRQRYENDGFDYDKELSDLDQMQANYESGNIDYAPSIKYGRDVNGARRRVRNMVATPGDLETMNNEPRQYTSGGYSGASNGKFSYGQRFESPTQTQSQQQTMFGDLSRYGQGAMMAQEMMMNATNPDDYYAAQTQLFNIINQRDAYNAQKSEADSLKASTNMDSKIATGIVLDPVMSTVNRIAAGAPERQYTAADINGMISKLNDLQTQALQISDYARRIEVMNRIDQAYGKLASIYGKKTAPSPRRDSNE